MPEIAAHPSRPSAYDGVEDLASFTPQRLRAYRSELLERTAPQAAFIAELIDGEGHALELACGNGRLLIELTRRGAIVRGDGLEIAASRVAFARRWAQDLELPALRFAAADVLQSEWPAPVDVVICITGAFAYFDPLRPGSGGELLRRAREALRPGGALVLELYPHTADRRLLEHTGGRLRTWRELAPGDPWRFYLSDLELDTAGEILAHHKVFIHRDGTVDEGRSERLRLFDGPEISRLLTTAGFDDIELFGDWSGRAPEPEDELVVAVARRRSGG